MTDLFIGRQPIFDRRLAVVGYELLYRAVAAGPANVVDGDRATTQVILNAFSELGIQHLVGSKTAYINATRNFLTGKIGIPMSPDKVMLEVIEDITIDEELIDGLSLLSRQGYQFALDDVTSFERIVPLLKLVSLVKIDLMAIDHATLPALIASFAPYRRRVRLLAEKVETQAELDQCMKLGFDLFQGYFLCKPNVVSGRRLDSNRLVILQALGKIQDPKVNFTQLGNIVAQDVALSFKLLRLVNSAYYGVAQRVKSIQQAIAMLGMTQLRSWLTLLLIASIENKPHELTTIALNRAKFCELLAEARHLPPNEQYFLVGLLSVLDALLDQPMEVALAQLPLTPDLVGGILRHEGAAGELLELVLAYERGDWERLLQTELTTEVLRAAYIKAVRWSTMMSKGLRG